GGPGIPPRVEYVAPDGRTLPLRKDDIALEANACLRVVSGGGGGNGPAHERSIDAVLADLADGYISRQAAARDYGVVFADPDGTIDREATAAAREALS